jgi:hypothetical protein
MERELLIKYLKFLAERADALVRKDVVEDYDVAVLKRELRDFKARFGSTSAGVRPSIGRLPRSICA